MISREFTDYTTHEIETLKEGGLYKQYRVFEGRQGRSVTLGGREMLNFCANNYLGLAGSELVSDFASKVVNEYGYGLSSVRFICGSTTLHDTLERSVADFLRMESALCFNSCWDANEGLFAALFGPEDVILSDAMNHASIIDGMRLCKAERAVYGHKDMQDLEEKLKSMSDKRFRCIVTDGVFSMEGTYAPLPEICDLADKYDALVVVDDSHATGFVGQEGRGTPEKFGVEGRVDVVTTTFGKALGGALGGCIAGSQSLISLLHQKARTLLFTNALPPVVAGTTVKILEYLSEHPEIRSNLWDRVAQFRKLLREAGMELSEDVHPIVPIMIGDEKKNQEVGRQMFEQGIFVIPFSYPVVPKGAARVRVQISAAHTEEDIERFAEVFRGIM